MMQNKKMSLSPLQLMQRFYNDYNRRQSHASSEIPACKYARKKSSNTDKMTRFLMDQEKKDRGYSTITLDGYKNKTGQSSILSPNRYKVSTSQASKRCYFKSSYSQSHPFLTSAHKIEQKNVDDVKALKTEPIEYSSGAYQNLKLMSPMQNRQIIKEMKDTMIRIKHFKKQKLDRVRYNYLVSNCFKNHSPIRTNQQTESRIRYSQTNTKQRIFPSNNLKL